MVSNPLSYLQIMGRDSECSTAGFRPSTYSSLNVVGLKCLFLLMNCTRALANDQWKRSKCFRAVAECDDDVARCQHSFRAQ